MRQKGQALIQTLGMLLVTLMTGAFAIDAGFYFTVHRGMQNAADAAALSAAAELFRSSALTSADKQAAARTAAKSISQQNMGNQLNDTDIEFGYVNPLTGAYNNSTFTNPTNNTAFALTGGYNAVRVTVRAASGQANSSIPALFSNYLGFNNFDSSAQAVAIFGGGVQQASGLRPVYMCQAAWDTAVSQYGDPTVPQVTFYGDTLQVGTTTIDANASCGNMGPGNWGLADLDNGAGAPGASTVRGWFENGYNGPVNVGDYYDSMPGNQLHSYNTELTTLRNNQTVIQIPLYNQTNGEGGSNMKYRVSQIASFVITDFQTTGSKKYLRGYFKKSICTGNSCSFGNTLAGGGVTRLRLVH